MDIAGLSMSMSTQNVHNNIEILMLSKSLDTMKTMGDGLQKVLESSVTPHLGQNIDLSV